MTRVVYPATFRSVHFSAAPPSSYPLWCLPSSVSVTGVQEGAGGPEGGPGPADTANTSTQTSCGPGLKVSITTREVKGLVLRPGASATQGCGFGKHSHCFPQANLSSPQGWEGKAGWGLQGTQWSSLIWGLRAGQAHPQKHTRARTLHKCWSRWTFKPRDYPGAWKICCTNLIMLNSSIMLFPP